MPVTRLGQVLDRVGESERLLEMERCRLVEPKEIRAMDYF